MLVAQPRCASYCTKACSSVRVGGTDLLGKFLPRLIDVFRCVRDTLKAWIWIGLAYHANERNPRVTSCLLIAVSSRTSRS